MSVGVETIDCIYKNSIKEPMKQFNFWECNHEKDREIPLSDGLGIKILYKNTVLRWEQG